VAAGGGVITHIEIEGFKSFQKVSLDLSLGTSAAGRFNEPKADHGKP
jgi:hypothetical protein